MTVPARRRPLALAAAVATAAAALGATALTAPAAHAAGGPPPMTLKDGTLGWGLKKSFRDYVEGGFANGAIKTTDGAQRTADGSFAFTDGKGTYDMSTHAVGSTFKGGVRFTGHEGELDITFADVKLAGDAGGKTGRITADVTKDGKTQDDVPIAALDLAAAKRTMGAGGKVTFDGIPATLTAEGAKVFSYQGRSMYKQGAELDKATFTTTAVTDAQPQPQPKPKPKPEPSEGGEGKKDGGASKNDASKGDGAPKGDKAPAKSDGKPVSGPVSDGRLDWGLKKSFRDYVTGGFAQGKAEVFGDAVKLADGYRFTKAGGTYDASANTLDVAFKGEVRFTGHEGQLDLRFSNFKVKASGSGDATLSADVASKGTVTLAKLKLGANALKATNGVVTLSAVPATLTAEGAGVFSYQGRAMYKEGTALDPVSLAVTVGKNAKLPGGGQSAGAGTPTGGGGAKGGVTGEEASLAATGADTPTGPLLGGAVALTLAGGAAVYATRRRSALAKG
ncbi:HtaA domain-containing protein [Streptomyces sp. UNOB3_S3]|uniref:HtaA domain-containing protein n=1 Tax=Streptomyces sp. UNOB3_S3 TaxID=2871682 RepID=UPI001E5C21BC|nr:HtaA domain-containing protein [Streptomyces sp. UNOB3_S3]MCC3775451.1 HtaA domain-containing protein [Streptomyces sp. UNOB3_S3]